MRRSSELVKNSVISKVSMYERMWGLGLSAGDVLGCTSAVAGDARFANFGVARRARPVEGVGFAGLAVTGHAEKSGFDGALLSAGGHWSTPCVRQGRARLLARYVNVRQSGARVARCVRSSRRGTPRRVRRGRAPRAGRRSGGDRLTGRARA